MRVTSHICDRIAYILTENRIYLQKIDDIRPKIEYCNAWPAIASLQYNLHVKAPLKYPEQKA